MTKAEREKEVETTAKLIFDENRGDTEYFYPFAIGWIRGIVTSSRPAKVKMDKILITLEALELARNMNQSTEGGNRTG